MVWIWSLVRVLRDIICPLGSGPGLFEGVVGEMLVWGEFLFLELFWVGFLGCFGLSSSSSVLAFWC